MIPQITPGFWLVTLLIAGVQAFSLTSFIAWLLVIPLSILVHEYGHAVTARLFGCEVQVLLMPFGGLTQQRGAQLPSFAQFLVVLNGPIAGALLAAVSFFALHWRGGVEQPLFQEIFLVSFVVNTFWTAFNLLPIYPMDGGQLLRILLGGAFGATGWRLTAAIGLCLSVGLAALAFFYNQLLVGSLLLLFAFENVQNYRTARWLRQEDSSSSVREMLMAAEEALTAGRRKEAMEQLERLLRVATGGAVHRRAKMLVAREFAKEERFTEAWQQLETIAEACSEREELFLQYVAFRAENYQAAIRYGNRICQRMLSKEAATINALAHASLRDVSQTLGWLGYLSSRFSGELLQLLDRREFDFLCGNPLFEQLRSAFTKH